MGWLAGLLAGPLKWLASFLIEKVIVAFKNYLAAQAEKRRRNHEIDEALKRMQNATTPEDQEKAHREYLEALRRYL